jgi:hypothetical protein
VKWKGYPDSENTWEPEETLTGCKELIAAWRAEHDTPEAARRPLPPPPKPAKPPKPPKIGTARPLFEKLTPSEDEDAAILRIANSPSFLARFGPKPPPPPPGARLSCDPPGRWESGDLCYMMCQPSYSERTVCEEPEESKLVVLDRRFVNDNAWYSVSYGAALTHWMSDAEIHSLAPDALLDWYQDQLMRQIYMSRDRIKRDDDPPSS